MGIGVAFALAAGLLWGLAFVGPLLLPDYPAPLVVAGRYLAFGLVALPLAWWDRAELAALSRRDWMEALKLSAVGNLLYYLFLASALQRAGGPMPTLIIGTLPVVIAVVANVVHRQRDGYLPWSLLAPCLAMVLTGIACVNHVEAGPLNSRSDTDQSRYVGGVLLAVCAVVCWAWYALRNARWLRRQTGRSPRLGDCTGRCHVAHGAAGVWRLLGVEHGNGRVRRASSGAAAVGVSGDWTGTGVAGLLARHPLLE